MVQLRIPSGQSRIALDKRPYVQAFWVSGATTKTRIVRGKRFLERFYQSATFPKVVGGKRFELLTPWFEARCSIQLS